MVQRRALGTVVLACAAFGALSGCSSSEAAVSQQTGAAVFRHQPVVVELFQSQGCSSCPPANATLNAIADRSDILALSFAVTYWDRLGWKDTFGSPRFTARQEDYARAGRGQVATPEFIVNGTDAVVGSNRASLDAAIARARPAGSGPAISTGSSGIRIEKASTGATPATVLLVRYDPRTRQVPIRAGENGGRTLPHRNIVRELVKLGDWTGAAASFALPRPREDGLVAAVLVQRGGGGPIISARKL